MQIGFVFFSRKLIQSQWTQNGYQKDIRLWTSQCSEDFEWQHLPLLITFKTH